MVADVGGTTNEKCLARGSAAIMPPITLYRLAVALRPCSLGMAQGANPIQQLVRSTYAIERIFS